MAAAVAPLAARCARVAGLEECRCSGNAAVVPSSPLFDKEWDSNGHSWSTNRQSCSRMPSKGLTALVPWPAAGCRAVGSYHLRGPRTLSRLHVHAPAPALAFPSTHTQTHQTLPLACLRDWGQAKRRPSSTSSPTLSSWWATTWTCATGWPKTAGGRSSPRAASSRRAWGLVLAVPRGLRLGVWHPAGG